MKWLREGSKDYVRINAADTTWFSEDVASLRNNRAVLGIVVPKTVDAATLRFFGDGGHPDLVILPLIESASGFQALEEIASAPRVDRLMFGTVDFQVDTGILGDGDELSHFRSQLTTASRLAGTGTPVNGVTTAIEDARPIEEAARRTRRYGFGGKLCIHPKQVLPTNRVFALTSEECEWARRVIDAAEASADSATVVDGKMIGPPLIERARTVLSAAR